MSINVEELKTVRVIDPRLDINSTNNKTYGIFDGAGQITWKQFISTSFNASQISFTCNPPNERVYVNRKLYITTTFRIDFLGTAPGTGAGQTLLQAKGLKTLAGVSPGAAHYDAPRCLPMASAISTAQIGMNNDNISSNLNSYWRIMERYHNTYADQNGSYSGTPTMPDMSQEYNELAMGFPLNPLAEYGDNPVQCPRGGFIDAVIEINQVQQGVPGQDAARVTLTVTEPFYLSPWLFGAGQEDTAFIQIQTLNILLTLNGRGNGPLAGLGSALWSHSNSPGAGTLASTTVTVIGSSALFSYMTPDITQSIPSVINYSYFEPNLYATTFDAALPSGASTQYNMNTVNLKSIPNRMYIFVAERDQNCNISTTDTYFAITNLNVTFINVDGLFANATQYDLFQMSQRAGCNLSWRQFKNDVGSVICVQFGVDLALGALQAPGLRGNFSLSMKVTATNVNTTRDIFPTLSVLVINEGVMTIDKQSVIRSVGVLNEKDILASKEMAPVGYKPSGNVYGSGFWKNVQEWFKKQSPKKAIRAAIDVGKVLSPGNPYLTAADLGAKSLGFGRTGGAMVGGSREPRTRGRQSTKKQPRQGAIGTFEGGARLPRSQLLQMLNQDYSDDEKE